MAESKNLSAVNPQYIVGALAVIAAAGGAYWFFTQKPKSRIDESLEKQQASNAAAAEKKDAAAKESASSAAKDYSGYATWLGVFPNAPKTAGKRSLGDSIVIRAGVKPRRLNEKLEYVEDAEAKNVQVRLGSIWGWAGADHSLVTKGGAAPYIIVKSDDVKIAPFYEIKGSDALTGNESIVQKAKDKVLSYFDDGHGHIGADGFHYIGGMPAHVFDDDRMNNKGYGRGVKRNAPVVRTSIKKPIGGYQNAQGVESEIVYDNLTPYNSWNL